MRKLGQLTALGLMLMFAVSAFAGETLVDNPMYKFWASHKPGATSVYHEVTEYKGPEKAGLPSGREDKTVTYKLISIDDKKAVVQSNVLEKEFLGVLETAPSKMHYPAKIKKEHLEAVMEEFGAKKTGEEMIKVGKEELKCKLLEGSHKTGTETVDFKFCYSDTVPGGIVKRMRVSKEGDKVVAETTIMLKSFTLGKEKEKKDKKTEK